MSTESHVRRDDSSHPDYNSIFTSADAHGFLAKWPLLFRRVISRGQAPISSCRFLFYLTRQETRMHGRRPERQDREQESLTRIAIVNNDRCKPKKCNQECKRSWFVHLPLNPKAIFLLPLVQWTKRANCVSKYRRNQKFRISLRSYVSVVVFAWRNVHSTLSRSSIYRVIWTKTPPIVSALIHSNCIVCRLLVPAKFWVLSARTVQVKRQPCASWLENWNRIWANIRSVRRALHSMMMSNDYPVQTPPDWQDILKFFRGSELQNYFTKILEENLKAILKPQYVDQIPRATQVRSRCDSADSRRRTVHSFAFRVECRNCSIRKMNWATKMTSSDCSICRTWRIVRSKTCPAENCNASLVPWFASRRATSSCSTNHPVTWMWSNVWKRLWQFETSFDKIGASLSYVIDQRCLFLCHWQIHHRGRTRSLRIGLSIRFHMRSLRFTWALWCCDHALLRSRRSAREENEGETDLISMGALQESTYSWKALFERRIYVSAKWHWRSRWWKMHLKRKSNGCPPISIQRWERIWAGSTSPSMRDHSQNRKSSFCSERMERVSANEERERQSNDDVLAGKTTLIRMLAGNLEPDDGGTLLYLLFVECDFSLVEIPQLNISYKPQKISPKFSGTVRDLLNSKIREAIFHPQFQTDVSRPLMIDNIIDQEVNSARVRLELDSSASN